MTLDVALRNERLRYVVDCLREITVRSQGGNAEGLARELVRASRVGRPPDKAWSLWEHYRYRLKQARTDPVRTDAILFLAERDIAEHRAGEMARAHRDHVMLSEFEGVPSEVVAGWAGVANQTVRKIRQREGRDARLGERCTPELPIAYTESHT